MINKNVNVGGIYKSHYSWDEEGDARFIVTAVGLNHVLIADYPMIKFNESYMEYCVGRNEFESKFELAEETKMKLIDLLVQELPKRGGWPEGVVKIHQDYDGETWSWLNSDSAELLFTLDQVATNARKFGEHEKCENMVTHDQYESALAESQKTAWNGDGLPQVGCECEYRDNNGEWYPVTIKYASDQLVVISGITKILGVEQGTEIAKDIIIDKPQFRQLRTESERKHEAALESICAVLEMVAQDYSRKDEAKLIYEAIAAGKIPVVKLED